MSNRVTEKQLQYLVDQLNKETNNPMVYSIKNSDGKHETQVGHYHLSFAYGGVMLAQTMNTSGGIDCPLGAYHRPKKELYFQLDAFLKGITLNK